MKIGVIGAGAIGGLLGAKLALAGETVTFVERDEAHRRAIERDGLKVLMHDGEELLATGCKAVADVREAGVQDVVLLALKAHHIASVAPHIGTMFGPSTTVVTVQNGIPWWYFQKLGGTFDGRTIEAVDPGGMIAKNIEADRIIGCVPYPAGEIVGPGVIKHVEGNRFSLGELDNSKSERVEALTVLLTKAGFKSFVLDDIRAEMWLKLWGNLSFNPISAMTHATLVDICRFPLTRDLAAKMMGEAQSVANALGVTFRLTIEKRIAGAEGVGAHKTSMLQDVEAGRALEIEALIGAVVEMARLVEIPTPHVDAMYACIELLDHTMANEQAGFPAAPRAGTNGQSPALTASR